MYKGDLLLFSTLLLTQSVNVLMEALVHNMGTMLPAFAQWDILEISVKVSDC